MSRIQHLAEPSFDALVGAAQEPVLVDDWAAWCAAPKAQLVNAVERVLAAPAAA